jgi:hypothetical protein
MVPSLKVQYESLEIAVERWAKRSVAQILLRRLWGRFTDRCNAITLDESHNAVSAVPDSFSRAPGFVRHNCGSVSEPNRHGPRLGCVRRQGSARRDTVGARGVGRGRGSR